MRYTTDPNYKDLSLTVRSFLHSDEELLWTGRPYATQPYRSSVFLVLFSIFWLVFSIFWTVGATAAGGAFGLFGVPFMIIGCYLVYSVTVGQRKTLSETVYAVTDRRALIITKGKNGLDVRRMILQR